MIAVFNVHALLTLPLQRARCPHRGCSQWCGSSGCDKHPRDNKCRGVRRKRGRPPVWCKKAPLAGQPLCLEHTRQAAYKGTVRAALCGGAQVTDGDVSPCVPLWQVGHDMCLFSAGLHNVLLLR
jgi:hypothetical protein